MTSLFISDLHLEDDQPETCDWLIGFLEGPARTARDVYILGDLFEAWIGDDALSATARRVADSINELVTFGVPCYFLHGNRDFLLGESYAKSAGFTILPEAVVIDLYGKPTLLLHGDTLCTDDVEYQVFRQQSRNPAWQAGIRALSIEQRLQLAKTAREASKEHTGTTSMDIMDVNENTVLETFRQYDVQRMIHGHTHRPAFHQHPLTDGGIGERIVLSDWYSEGSYLKVGPEQAESVKLV